MLGRRIARGMRVAWLVAAVLIAGCASSEGPDPSSSPPSLEEDSSAIRYAPEGDAPAATEAFVFEKRFSQETTTIVERFLVEGGSGLSVAWWTEDSSGSLTASLVDAAGEAHPLSFGPDGVEGATSLAAVDGEWRLEADLTAWSGLVHVSVTAE